MVDPVLFTNISNSPSLGMSNVHHYLPLLMLDIAIWICFDQ